MFTGIIQSVATIEKITDQKGIRSFIIHFESGFTEELEIGASVAVDGVCLTVTEFKSINKVSFDVILISLQITTLSEYQAGMRVNVERAAKEGAEIGGHLLSGHIDFKTQITEVRKLQENYCIRFELPERWGRYVYSKGYIALNGASLTIADVDEGKRWFEVWLIPETRRMTTFESKNRGDHINIEIERSTQVLVDTVREAVAEQLGDVRPILEQLLEQSSSTIEGLSAEIQASIQQKQSKK